MITALIAMSTSGRNKPQYRRRMDISSTTCTQLWSVSLAYTLRGDECKFDGREGENLAFFAILSRLFLFSCCRSLIFFFNASSYSRSLFLSTFVLPLFERSPELDFRIAQEMKELVLDLDQLESLLRDREPKRTCALRLSAMTLIVVEAI